MRFDLHSFTSPGRLAAFLKNSPRQFDILLYGNTFAIGELNEELNADRIHTVIRLVGGNVSGTGDDGEAISKYKHAEMLVKDILYAFSKKSRINFVPDGEKKTIIASVHSSSGGAGNTSIAAGLSMVSSRRGCKSLYLNLEGIPSTGFYFKGSSDRTFSDIIFYLKDRDSSLALKLEGACCIDPASGVHFLLPPESVAELEDLAVEDIDLLFKTLRASCRFDFVFVDLPPDIGCRSLFIIKSSDVLVKVRTQDMRSGFRDNMLEKELAIKGNGMREDFAAKTCCVLNKYVEDVGFNYHVTVDKSRFHIINESESLKHYNGDRQLIEADASFSASLGRLLDCVISAAGAGNGSDGGGINV